MNKENDTKIIVLGGLINLQLIFIDYRPIILIIYIIIIIYNLMIL